MLAITVYCTKNYTYAIAAQIPLVVQALRYAQVDKAMFIMAGDDSDEVRAAYKAYSDAMRLMGNESFFVHVNAPDNANQEHRALTNLGIADMQNAAWHLARVKGATACWSVESDILPQPKTLRVLYGCLNFDPGWYDIAMSTYPNSGFLGGHATPSRWICPNAYPDEKKLHLDLQKRVEKRQKAEAALIRKKQQPTIVQMEEWRSIDREIEACPAKGNVFALNAPRWRRRGWFDYAYPGLGQGALVPTWWVGLGCTLMSKRALDLACFTGYDGEGTQDLWLCWRVWHAAELRMGVTSHAICSHVKKRRVAVSHEGAFCKLPVLEPRLFIMHARHEMGGEYHGHLRMEEKEWKGV